jgi:hypothetical protein
VGGVIGVSSRGTVRTTHFVARCKDCGNEFVYPESWVEDVVEHGGSRSDRCPECRQVHLKDTRSMAVPYIELDVIGRVADPSRPSGRLGGLGPLPTEHDEQHDDRDLSQYDFGLTDADVVKLLDELEDKQVAVVVAGTGSGKSTFLPYRLMEPPDDVALRLAARGPIIVTEPRRAAAIDTARFAAEVLHGAPKVGAGCDIGYRVKDKPAFDSACRLIYVTDGSLINWIREGQLDKFGAIIVDEAHERNKNIDIILGVLRSLARRHPHLKIIVASATIDAEFFVEYFGGRDEVALLEVSAEKQFGYGTPIWPCEDVDASHPDWSGGQLHGIPLQEYARRLADLRVVREPVLAGRNFQNWRGQMPGLVVEQVVALHRGTPAGDILAFLPTEAAIKDAVRLLGDELGDDAEVFGFYRNASEATQLRARARRAPDATRRIVVATNIAETSLTIDGLTFVVDSGLICQSRWDPDTASKSMPSIAHSQDGARQRWGRVGRKEPGFVLPLYTREQYGEFELHTPPEAVRDDLEAFELTAASIGIDAIDGFDFPAEFHRNATTDGYSQIFVKERQRSRRALVARRALDTDVDVTQFGAELLAYPGPAGEAGALIGADELCCTVETAVALALLLGQRPIGTFMRFKPKWEAELRAAVRRMHEATMAGCADDLDLALKVYSGWESATDTSAWAAAHYVNHGRMVAARDGRSKRLEFLSPGRSAVLEPVRLELAARVRAVLARALIDYTFVKQGSGWQPLAGDDGIRYELDALARPPSTDRVLALRRLPGSRPRTAYLSALVNAPEWAVDAKDWTVLAVEAATRLRDTTGQLVGATKDDHWALDAALPVGSRVAVDAVGDRLNVRAVLSRAALARLPDDELADETEDEVVEVAEDAAADEADGLAMLESRVEEILDAEALHEFVDVTSLEDDGVDELSGPLGASAQAPATLGEFRAARRDGAPPCTGTYVIVGYRGLGHEREVVVDFEPEISGSTVTPGDKITADATDVVMGWGPPFVCVRERSTGRELCLGSEDLTFSHRDQSVAALVPVGAAFELVVTEVDPQGGVQSATRLPLVQEHLLKERPTNIEEGGTRHEVRPATVTGERWGEKWVVIGLDHSDVTTGLVHRYTAHERALGHITPLPGTPVLVELKTKAAVDGTVWTTKRFTRLPPDLETFCGNRDDVQLDPSTGTLGSRERMSIATRDRLAAFSADGNWRRAVFNLWRESNTLVVSGVYASEGTLDFTMRAAELLLGQRRRARVTGFSNGNAWISIDGLYSTQLHRSRIGADGVDDASNDLRQGDEIDVIIEEVKPGRGDKVYITCSAPDVQSAVAAYEPAQRAQTKVELRPSSIESVRERYHAGDPVSAQITSMSDSAGRAWLVLPDGSPATVAKPDIDGFIVRMSAALALGQLVEAIVKDVAEVRGTVQVQLYLKGFSAPALENQLADSGIYVRSIMEGTVGTVDAKLGLFVQVAEGVDEGLLHASGLPPGSLSSFRRGDRVMVEVTDARPDQRKPWKLRLSLRYVSPA